MRSGIATFAPSPAITRPTAKSTRSVAVTFISASRCFEASTGLTGRYPASLMHLNVRPMPVDIVPQNLRNRSENVMAELSEQAASGSPQSAANAEAKATKLNQSVLEFIFGAQRMMVEEFVFFTDEMLERARTEMHLFTEFVAKMAGAHSVKDVK